MSRKKKQKRGFNNDEVWVLGAGGVLLVLGIISILVALFRINEIAQSEDAKEFEAVVTYSEVKSHELSRDEKRRVEQGEYVAPDNYYKAKVTIEVDGKTYKGNYYSEEVLTKGSKVTVYAYQTKTGKWKIVDPLKYDFANYIITGVIAILIGGGLCLMCVLSRAMDNADAKNNNGKKPHK